MLSIAVCDDEAPQRVSCVAMIEKYAAERCISVETREFSAASELLFALECGERYDIYIIDVIMPNMNGIELGCALHKADDSALIIFISPSRDQAVESYEARAFNYLLKPLSERKFFGVLDDAAQILSKSPSEKILVKTKDGMTCLPTEDIYYVKLENRSLCYVCRSGRVMSTTIRAPFSEAVENLFAGKGFCMCGTSIAVNLNYIKMVERDCIVLTTGEQLYPPKKSLPTLRSSWIAHLMRRPA